VNRHFDNVVSSWGAFCPSNNSGIFSDIIFRIIFVTEARRVLMDVITGILNITYPVPGASRSKARTVFDRLNTGIVGSNPARGMEICPRFSVLCCPV
jgi:hypothetical protein